MTLGMHSSCKMVLSRPPVILATSSIMTFIMITLAKILTKQEEDLDLTENLLVCDFHSVSIGITL